MRPIPCRYRRSFTLIEVTLGLAILILIFGVIFQLVQMSVLGADAAGRNSLRCREVSGLFALVRQLCLDLPVRSQLVLEPRRGGYDLVLSNAPLAILPARGGGISTLSLAVRKDPLSGGSQLVMQEVMQTTNAQERRTDSTTNAFILMKDLVSIGWSARNPLNRDEQNSWNDPIKPAYLKLELVRRDGERKITNTGIFWIPTGYDSSGRPPVDPVTRNPLTNTNQTNQG